VTGLGGALLEGVHRPELVHIRFLLRT
jgi:hypothetical protein